MRLTDIVRRYQGDRQNLEFAREIDVDPSLISRLHNGRLDMSLVIVRALWRRYPESQAELIEFLREAPLEASHAAIA